MRPLGDPSRARSRQRGRLRTRRRPVRYRGFSTRRHFADECARHAREAAARLVSLPLRALSAVRGRLAPDPHDDHVPS